MYIYKHFIKNKNVAFKDVVKYFGGSLIILIPKQKINLDIIVSYLKVTLCFMGGLK